MPLNNIFSFIKQMINCLKKAFLEVCIPHRRIRRILKGDIAKHYLKKYVKIVAQRQANLPIKEEIKDYTIWQFWDNGIENAPDIVKACIKSIEKYEPDKKRVILQENNISDYVEIPGWIYDLKNSGKMKTANFSDILRTCLLIEHGGCWIDSTIFLSGKIPDYIINSDLFLFRNYENADLDGLNCTNYFIHSLPQNKILKDTRDVLYEYWKDNNYIMNYFIYMHALTMVSHSDKENKKIWADMPFVSFIPVQHFAKELIRPYNQQKWEQIKSSSNIHKLSYKNKVLGIKESTSFDGTFMEKLLKGELL